MSAKCNTCYIESTEPEWVARITASIRVDEPCARHADDFDAAFTEHDRQIAERAWNEGFDLATRNNPNKPHPMREWNPYREEKNDE